MKKSSFKKSALILISIIILISLITFFQNIGFDKISAYLSDFTFSDEFETKKPLSTKNFDMLNKTEKQAYICVLNKIENHPEYIKIPKLSQDEFTNVYFAVKNDNPDMLCFSDSCNMITFMSTCFLQLSYDYEKDICSSMTEELYATVYEIMDSIDMSDEYTAELSIHDYIVMNCSYTENAKNASNAYGCLVDGEAVCSGYSRATMILLYEAGIESMLVGGTGITSENESISHMWNIVWIDGEPYHLDVTWDDPTSSSNAISHLFFNLTTEHISSDHKDLSVDIACDAVEANYFVREHLLFDEYNSQTLSSLMTRLVDNINSGRNYLEIEFSNNTAYNNAVNAIIDNSTHSSDMYKIINYISEHTKNKVDTSHINFVQENEKYYIRLMFDSI